MAKQTLEEINREIAEVELETKKLNLQESRQRLKDHNEKERKRHEANRQRQSEIKQIALNQKQRTEGCRHKSGGTPTNIAKGGGKFAYSLITRAIMPDGVTVFLQCARCALSKMPYAFGNPKLSALALKKMEIEEPQKFINHMKFMKLYEDSLEDGIEHAEVRGPTFVFEKFTDAGERVPFIPALV